MQEQKQMTMPEIHVHTEQVPVVKESFPTQAIWGITATIIATVILVIVNRWKK